MGESFRRSRSESKAGLERTNLQLRNQVERVAQDAARQHETDIGEHYRRKHSFVEMQTTLGEQLKRLQSKLNGSPSPHELKALRLEVQEAGKTYRHVRKINAEVHSRNAALQKQVDCKNNKLYATCLLSRVDKKTMRMGKKVKTQSRWLVDADTDSILYMNEQSDSHISTTSNNNAITQTFNGKNFRVWLSRSFQTVKVRKRNNEKQVMVQFSRKGGASIKYFDNRWFENNKIAYAFLNHCYETLEGLKAENLSITIKNKTKLNKALGELKKYLGGSDTYHIRNDLGLKSIGDYVHALPTMASRHSNSSATTPLLHVAESQAPPQFDRVDAEAARIFDIIDIDKSNSISRTELLDAIKTTTSNSEEKSEAARMFQEINSGSDIDFDEFKSLFRRLHEARIGFRVLRRRMAQREFSNRRDSPVMTRLLEEIVAAQDN